MRTKYFWQVAAVAFFISTPTVFAAGALGDINGNGHWDRLEEIVLMTPPSLQPVSLELASSIQDLAMAPVGNKTFAVQAMTKGQSSLLCLMSVIGKKGSDMARVMKEIVVRDSYWGPRFQANEQSLVGTEFPFEEDPTKWYVTYCPEGTLKIPDTGPPPINERL